jgi:predicted Zn-dependent protease
MLRIFFGISVFGLSLVCFEACVTNSEGRKTIMPMPDSQVNGMGVEAYAEVISQAKAKNQLVSKNHATHEVVERIGRRIAASSGVDFEWEFAVINEPKTVNAFCLPGGKIAVYTGLFPVAIDEASLAAIMGHEVAHATLRHGAERMSQQLAIAGIALGTQVSLGDSRYRDMIMGVFAVGAQFGVVLPFGRSHETEADAVGLRYAAEAGYDPSAAIGLWDRMGADGKSPPEFMSTHPDPSNRKKALTDRQSEARPIFERSDQQPQRKLPEIVAVRK